MCIRTYGLPNAWLDNCLKSPVSDDPATSRIVNGPKHCSKLNDSTFTIFINPWEDNSSLKNLSEWYGKSYDSLFTHWLSMTVLLFLTKVNIATFSDPIMSKTKNLKKIFFLHFPILFPILNIFKKMMTLIAEVFLSLRTPKYVVR